MTIVPRNNVPGKVCRVCKQWKPLNGFKGNGRSSDGYDHKCLDCRKPDYRSAHEWHNGTEGKVCTVCKQWKPLAEYCKHSRSVDGLNYRCNFCNREHVRTVWKSDPQAWSKRNARSYHRHRDKRLQSVRRYREENIVEIREKDRQRNKERYQKNPEQRAVYTHARRARERKADGRFTPSEWRAIKRKYGNRCLCCGKKPPQVKLTPDHVIPLSRGGSNGIDNIQPLCLTCNLQKATKVIDYRLAAKD